MIERYINTFMNVVGSTFFDFKTITSDNGTEFAGHEAISKITEADFYFARPYRSSVFISLALALGKTVNQLSQELSLSEFNEWLAYYSLEPFGVEKDDHRTALMVSAL
nr:hypothetical protein [Piscirickettsia salmonis]